MKYILAILLCVSGVIGFYIYNQYSSASYLTLKTPFEKYDEYINFEYEKPIDGIKITGTFNPQVWSCGGYFKGEVNLVFTRLIDSKSFEFSLDHVTFFNSDICLEPKDYDEGCKFKDNIILKHEETSDFLDKQPLKIVDFDFDGKKEIILLRGCGVRGWEEFEAYDFYDTAEMFDINREQLIPNFTKTSVSGIVANPNVDYGKRNTSFYYNIRSKFDKNNKTVTLEGTWSSCGNIIDTFKSDGKGYKLIKKVIIDRPDWSKEQDVPGLCEINTYDIDEKGNSTLVGTICHEWVSSEWVDSKKCILPNQ